jgi:hypothetical protein
MVLILEALEAFSKFFETDIPCQKQLETASNIIYHIKVG